MGKFRDDDEDDDDWTRNSKKNPVEAVLFNGSIKKDDVTELLTEVVEVGLNGGSKKWEPLLFSNHKTARRTDLARTYLESKQLPPVPSTAAVSVASTSVAVPVTPRHATPRNNNNNSNTNGAENSTSVAPSNAVANAIVNAAAANVVAVP